MVHLTFTFTKAPPPAMPTTPAAHIDPKRPSYIAAPGPSRNPASAGSHHPNLLVPAAVLEHRSESCLHSAPQRSALRRRLRGRHDPPSIHAWLPRNVRRS